MIRRTPRAAPRPATGPSPQGFDAVLDGIQRTQGERFYGTLHADALPGAERPRLVRAPTTTTRTGWPWRTSSRLRPLRRHRHHQPYRGRRRCYSRHHDQRPGIPPAAARTPAATGGITAHTQKATASNAGPVITAVRLYERTGKTPRILELRDPGVYAYWCGQHGRPDHVRGHRSHGRRWRGSSAYKFTYNEGLMVGAGVELHEATGLASYLQQAQEIAGFSLASETTSTTYGKVLFDGANASCGGSCEQFKGIGHRYLSEAQRHRAHRDPHVAAGSRRERRLEPSALHWQHDVHRELGRPDRQHDHRRRRQLGDDGAQRLHRERGTRTRSNRQRRHLRGRGWRPPRARLRGLARRLLRLGLRGRLEYRWPVGRLPPDRTERRQLRAALPLRGRSRQRLALPLRERRHCRGQPRARYHGELEYYAAVTATVALEAGENTVSLIYNASRWAARTT